MDRRGRSKDQIRLWFFKRKKQKSKEFRLGRDRLQLDPVFNVQRSRSRKTTTSDLDSRDAAQLTQDARVSKLRKTKTKQKQKREVQTNAMCFAVENKRPPSRRAKFAHLLAHSFGLA